MNDQTTTQAGRNWVRGGGGGGPLVRRATRSTFPLLLVSLIKISKKKYKVAIPRVCNSEASANTPNYERKLLYRQFN